MTPNKGANLISQILSQILLSLSFYLMIYAIWTFANGQEDKTLSSVGGSLLLHKIEGWYSRRQKKPPTTLDKPSA